MTELFICYYCDLFYTCWFPSSFLIPLHQRITLTHNRYISTQFFTTFPQFWKFSGVFGQRYSPSLLNYAEMETRSGDMHRSARQAEAAGTTHGTPVCSPDKCSLPGKQNRQTASSNLQKLRLLMLPLPSGPHHGAIEKLTTFFVYPCHNKVNNGQCNILSAMRQDFLSK